MSWTMITLRANFFILNCSIYKIGEVLMIRNDKLYFLALMMIMFIFISVIHTCIQNDIRFRVYQHPGKER